MGTARMARAAPSQEPRGLLRLLDFFDFFTLFSSFRTC